MKILHVLRTFIIFADVKKSKDKIYKFLRLNHHFRLHLREALRLVDLRMAVRRRQLSNPRDGDGQSGDVRHRLLHNVGILPLRSRIQRH